MLLFEKQQIRWLEFEIFQEFKMLSHAILLKNEKNNNLGLEEQKNLFRNNIKTVMQCGKIFLPHLVHQDHILEAPFSFQDRQGDAAMTQKLDMCLGISHADCQVAIFYDPTRQALALVHAGWRGNVLNIYQKTIQKLQGLYGCKPSNLYVGVSPSLGPCCAQFIHYQKELPPAFWDFQVRPLYFDLWDIARQQLLSAGVLDGHIQMAQICTCCHEKDYFSYRRDQTNKRHLTAAVIDA